MGLADIVRSGIALANALTDSLQGTVSIERWTGQSNTGVPTYAAAFEVKAIVEPSKVWSKNPTGGDMFLTSKVSILQPLDPQGTAGRDEPLDQRDRITLPDGSTCPISMVDGSIMDPATGRPMLFMVTLVR